MLSKNEAKYIQSLYKKKYRDEEGLFIAEGPKLAGELLTSALEIRQIYATSKWIAGHAITNLPVTEITESELQLVSNLKSPNEVLVIAQQKPVDDEPVLPGKLTIVLDGIQDPGNMGTIIRIADWFGLTQIVCSNDSVEVYNPKVIQSAMGSMCRVTCWYKDLSNWQTEPLPVYGALLNGKNLYHLEKVSEGLLVIGNESKGIREPFLSRITHPVTIPKTGGAESLNAAVATGIIIGHFVNSK